MKKVFIQLGKTGDILNILPLLRKDAELGEKPSLMVSAQYAPVLDGCSYVEPIVFDGQPYELSRAIESLNGDFDRKVITQVVGPREEVRKSYAQIGASRANTESYQKEAWHLAGRLDEWKLQHPLVFDRRDKDREAALLATLPKKKRLMLVSTGGDSSPFPHVELLMRLLRLQFNRYYEIVDLSTIRAERFYDLLGLYEKAELLVSTDSAPLHLAYACKNLPVVALVNDKPSLWHGSAWRPNHIAHIRYGDFPKRAVEMLDVIVGVNKPGSCFRKWIATPQLLHIWSQYEVGPENVDRHKTAVKTWGDASDDEHWTDCKIEVGALGRDSSTGEMKDPKRYPFVKDVLRIASMRAADDDVLCLTRCDTAVPRDFTPRIFEAAKDGPVYAHRTILNDDGSTSFHPAVDVFAFTKAWWREHQSEYPDMIMGMDHHWHRVMKELVKSHGGKELSFFVSRKRGGPVQVQQSPPPRLIHNAGLASLWLGARGIRSSFPKVTEQLPSATLNPHSLFGGAYNPSLTRHNGQLLVVYRYHPRQNLSTGLAIAELDEHFNVTNNMPVRVIGGAAEKHSIEDARFFQRDGTLWLSHIISTWPTNPPKCWVRYGRLAKDQKEWVLHSDFQPEYGSNDGAGLEKNWAFFSRGEKLFAVYVTSPEQIVIELDGNKVVAEHKTKALPWAWGDVRGGGEPLEHNGKLLRLFHSRLNNEPAPIVWRYYVGACLMDMEPPFAMTAIGSEPILKGSEIDNLDTAPFHHKKNIVFPGGAVTTDGGFLLSVGVNDCESVIAKLSEEDLRL